MDFSDVIVHCADLNQNQFKTSKEVKADKDCRLPKYFFDFGALRLAKELM